MIIVRTGTGEWSIIEAMVGHFMVRRGQARREMGEALMAAGTSGSNVLERAKVYHTIKLQLRRQLGRQWPVGTRLPPIKDLARQLKTGQTNTHRAVKELVREGLLVSRSGQGTFVTGQADPSQALPDSAETIETASGALAGTWVELLIAHHEPDLFIRRAMDAFTASLLAAGCKVTTNVYGSGRMENPLVTHTEADGLFIINPNSISMSAKPKQVVAVLNTALETSFGQSTGYDVVSPDSEQGGFLAGEHVRACGCTSAVFIGVPPTDGENTSLYDRTSSARLRGFEQGFGRKLPPEHRFRAVNYMTKEGALMVKDYLRLSPRPPAVFAASDELAIGFMHGALAHGLEAGKDVQIIGFDAQERAKAETNGPMTSIEVPMPELGRLAAQLLIERLHEPQRPVRRIQMGCKLFQGKTTVPKK